VHSRNQRHSIANATCVDDLFHLRRYVDIFAMLFGVEGEIFHMKFHAIARLIILSVEQFI
jgi:hypothetical protein